MARARLVGVNHVALEVGEIDDALAFYGSIFELTLRGRSRSMAFIDIGDQFIALSSVRSQPADEHRHFGLVVDSMDATRQALEDAGVAILGGRGLNFRDPWGNLIQVVQYDEVQFLKDAAVLRSLGLELGKSDSAIAELRAKGIEPGD
jgi:predicted enzyme related to lactoylglutathione lyase